MIRLQQWHKRLLISEALAALIVIWAYHDIAEAQIKQSFLGGLAGTGLLWPGLQLLGWPSHPNYPTISLITAAIYTATLFMLLTLIRSAYSRVITWVREEQVRRPLSDNSERLLR